VTLIGLILSLDRQTHIASAGRQQAHLCIPVRGNQEIQDACLSPPPHLPTSRLRQQYPTHLLPMRTEGVDHPRHYTHNARLSLPNNYAISRSRLCNHHSLSSPRVSRRLHYLQALSTPLVILLPLRRPSQTSFPSMMANFCLSSIVPRRFRTLSPQVQRID